MCSENTFGHGHPASPKTFRLVLILILFFSDIAFLPGQEVAGAGDNTVLDSIAQPWYNSYWAYLLLVLLALGLFSFVYFLWQGRKMVPQEQLLNEQRQSMQNLGAAREEKEQLQAEYHLLEERLEGVKKQLRSKTILLAKKTKKDDEKGRILRILKEEVDEITKQNDSIKFIWREASRILGAYHEAEENNFSVLLDELNQDFLVSLNKLYPELTSYDQRLCVYLKSGLKTREMAELMNVLPSSVNVSRSRLRKKLKLSPKDDLFKFLNKIK